MKPVTGHIRQRWQELFEHPFFAWLEKCGHPIEDRLLFSPILVEFIMGFADMNKWFLSYSPPGSKLEEAINEHTYEDRTHSRLFVEDWLKLRLNDRLAWTPSDTLWWWFDCSETELIRRLAMETLDLTVTHPDPLVRFPMIQAIEAVGDVFFSHTVKLAKELEKQTGLEYRYYGEYHRIRETGHLHTDEDEFTTATLTPEQREAALRLVNRMFDMFVEEIGHLLSYSRRATEDPRLLVDCLRREHRARLDRPACASPRWPAGPSHEGTASPAQARVHEVFARRMQRLSQHPFLQWLATDSTSPIQKLQRFVALWAVDILGYRDLQTYVLRYPDPKDARHRAINRWTEELASHGVLYLKDWLTLGIDRVLGWKAHEVIQFYFLDGHTETHRHNMAEAKTFAFKHKSPTMRYWLMRSLEGTGEVLFQSLAPLVADIESAKNVRLDYWAQRHFLAHPELAPDAEADAVRFMSVPLTGDEEQVAVQIVNGIFDNAEEQFTLSLEVARENYFKTSSDTEAYVSPKTLPSYTFADARPRAT